MTARKPVVGGNWKMNTNATAGRTLAEAIASRAEARDGVDVILCPPFPYLAAVGAVLDGTGIGLGAQNCHPEADGAFTGEVSLAMLRDCGVGTVIVGHSERRHLLGESDAFANAKTRAALDAGLGVILCVGETLDQREADLTQTVVLGQLAAGLKGIPAANLGRLIVAYEPVWAIGTGRTATPDDAARVHRDLRAELADRYDAAVAGRTRIQYGGSVKPDNAADLIAHDDIDGFLVGGASLDADAFTTILHTVATARRTSSAAAGGSPA